ncbi:uncharacterized protein LOC117110740 [Anneissia japonica]|uniref:uncharacterized protein LOC117110740 n=1 Tax=Anneissia japonica TaxID=1529436 RepID=UPI001425A06F|nr:uncharacterized protein LOC117110740 [Anneissia japonica]
MNRSGNLDINSVSLSRFTFASKGSGMEKNLLALGILSIVSTFCAILSVLLIFQLVNKQNGYAEYQKNADNALDEIIYDAILDSAIVLTSFAVMLNLCSSLVCAVQAYFGTKIFNLPQGEERSYKFMRSVAGARFLGIGAFFISIPTFLLALSAYIFLEFRVIPASLSTGFLGIGCIIVVFNISRTIYVWRKEERLVSAGFGLNEHDLFSNPGTSTTVDKSPILIGNNVSTLDLLDGSQLSTLV